MTVAADLDGALQKRQISIFTHMNAENKHPAAACCMLPAMQARGSLPTSGAAVETRLRKGWASVIQVLTLLNAFRK